MNTKLPLAALTMALLIVVSAALRPLMLPDEGRYAGVAWEMLRSGQWAVPTLDGLPFFHKPPLFYWISAAALGIGGVHPLAARAASLLAALAMAWALHRFVRRWSDADSAHTALLALVTLPLFFGGAQFANLDMLVAGCITLAVLAAAHAALRLRQGRATGPWLVAAYAFAGMGVLAKGLIGLVLPSLVIAAWLVVQRRPRDILRLVSARGGAVFALIALPWFVVVQERHGGFFDYFFVVQHFRRFAETGFNNVQPFWFYAVVLNALALPWTLCARPLFAAVFWRDPARGALRSLMGVWFAVVVLFFSLPQSKLVGYVLPVAVPLAFLLAEAARNAPQRALRVALAGALLCAALAAALVAFQPPGSANLARVLDAERRAGEPVVFVGRYFYDLPLLARLDAPVAVVDEWSRPPQRDNWQKELADAARFAPAAGAERLIDTTTFAARLCTSAITWVVAAPNAALPAPMRGLEPRAHARDGVLWRVARVVNDPSCPRTPNADPAGT